MTRNSLLFTSLGRFVVEELDYESASWFLADIDVEKDPWPSHVSKAGLLVERCSRFAVACHVDCGARAGRWKILVGQLCVGLSFE